MHSATIICGQKTFNTDIKIIITAILLIMYFIVDNEMRGLQKCESSAHTYNDDYILYVKLNLFSPSLSVTFISRIRSSHAKQCAKRNARIMSAISLNVFTFHFLNLIYVVMKMIGIIPSVT